MTRVELLKGLQQVLRVYGDNRKVTDMPVTLVKDIQQSLCQQYESKEVQSIIAAYFGFCFGREYGFQQGIDYVFNHEPTHEELGE